ncbi:glycerophosphoryl diester phosphodiesterase [Tenacibaculum sp. MAR_2009_124]|uniref:glycerophosphodiester phosphodiesterase n=1 Tax=Tenacibaculum sp. MAR_2009_124 TaxID=1250059 RepID=UPI00089BC810|nr:glycerophosphodiester phosphodiesterase [Tenacibaculum sp. MAR_2009_124]SEC52894.1 glycerophosphoryl diester phosphodiesterase [Tenacibaculum sp. MAR_2009_124]
MSLNEKTINRSIICNIVLIIFISISCKKDMNNSTNSKVVIAHRGASGYLPEHTMESKAMAYAMHPDYIEQDLVLSKDDIPIVIHDIYLDDVTNVATIFPERKREDGRYYVIDFTFDELQLLQVTERFQPSTGEQFYPNRFPKNKGNFRLHSLQQEIELIQGLNYSTGKSIGIYPEIKNPEFHHKNGKDIARITLDILSFYGYKTKEDNCILQCFDAKELERIRKELQSELFLVQLIEFPEETKQLQHFASYADGIGPWYKQILDKKENNKWLFTNLVEKAHELNLVVHPYTFRHDQLDEFSTFEEMMSVFFFEANIDGAFTDFPDKVVDFLRK